MDLRQRSPFRCPIFRPIAGGPAVVERKKAAKRPAQVAKAHLGAVALLPLLQFSLETKWIV